MSYIHFKSVVDTNFDKITFDGVSLPLAQLKKLIAEKKKYTKQVDFDLEITNTDTNEVYRNENDLIIKNSRVIVKRVVRNSTAPLRAREQPKVVSTPSQQTQQQQQHSTTTSSTASLATTAFSSSTNSTNLTNTQQVTSSSSTVNNSSTAAITITTTSNSNYINNLPKTVYDSLAPLNLPSKPIIYQSEIPSSTTNAINAESSTEKSNNNDSESTSRMDEKAKLESILLNSMTAQGVGINVIKPSADQHSLTHQTIMNNLPTNRYGVTTLPTTGKTNPMMMMIQNRHHLVPSSYRCGICKQTGHSKQQCPNAGLIPKLEERLKFPSGIPKTTLRPAKPGDKFAMLGPDGYVIAEIEQKVAQIKKKDKPSFMDDEDEENSNSSNDAQTLASNTAKIPQELKCPYGDHLLKDAVIIPCCGHFVCCDQCIREKISNDEIVECPNKDCDQEIGSLATITPFHEMRRKVNDYLNDLRLANQRAQAATQNTEIKSSSNDVFLDLILSGVDSESTKSPNINNIKQDEDLTEIKSEQQTAQSVSELSEGVVNSSGNESPKTQDSVISTTTEMSATKSTTIITTNNNSKIDQTVNNVNKFVGNPQMQPALLPAPPAQINPAIPTQIPIAPQQQLPVQNQNFSMNRPQLIYQSANIPKIRQTRPNPNLQPIIPQLGQPPQFNQYNRPPLGGPPPPYLNQGPIGGPPPHQMGFPQPPPQVMNQFQMQNQRPPFGPPPPFHQDLTSQYHHPSNLMIPPPHHLNPNIANLAHMPPQGMTPQTLPLAQTQNLNKLHHLGSLPPQQPLQVGYGQSAIPPHHPIMSEAEFYKYQETLRKEKELKSSSSSRNSKNYYDSRRATTTSSSNRRNSRSRSRSRSRSSRTRSRSSSRSSRSNSSGRNRRYNRYKSPENRSSYNRSTTSSYSSKHGRYYKRNSRSRSRSKERYNKKRSSYSRSRSRSPTKYSKTSGNSTGSNSTSQKESTKQKDISSTSGSSSSKSSSKKDKSSSSSKKEKSKSSTNDQPMPTIDENMVITITNDVVGDQPVDSSTYNKKKKKEKKDKEKERENDLTEISSSSSITSSTTNQKEGSIVAGSDTEKEKHHKKSSSHKSSKHKKHKHKRRSSSRDRD